MTKTAVAGLTVMLVSAAAPLTAVAASQSNGSHNAAAAVVFHRRFAFNFDQGESLNPGTKVADVTGNHHYGIVKVSGPGRLRVRPGVKGKAAGFPRRGCHGCGRAIIDITNNKHLNPFRHPFTFGATVRVTPRWAKPDSDPNIVQKGLYSHKGTQWKLQLSGARPSCVFNGTKHSVRLVSPLAIDDDTWHRLVCQRVGKVDTLMVDGVVQGTATAAIGQIANSEDVTVGGRAVGKKASNDQYHGNVDNIFMKVGTAR
jgi:concanavalin A-like lectin/glucanase superfamily protein